MLSFKPVSDAGGAAHYFESSDDYYAKEGHKGEWHGAGAQALGLAGGVDRETFKNLLDGQLPDGKKVRFSHARGTKDRKGIDFTFSAPKSVSIQALVNGDTRILAAHDKAVRESVQMLESFAAARKKEQGLSFRERTGKIIAASFRHELSRAQDPQLHSHAIVMNLTQRADGEWRALSNEDLLRNVKMIGAFYRANLAEQLKEIGYDLRETRKGGWELAHISDKAIQHFSKRSQEIEQLLNNRGQDRDSATTAQKQIITLTTREKKTDADRAWLKDQWLRTAKEAGIELDAHRSIRNMVTRAIDKHTTTIKEKLTGTKAADAAARESIDFAVEHLAERQGIFSRSEILVVAYGHAATRTSTAHVDQALQIAEKEGRVVSELPLYQTARSMNISANAMEKDAQAAHFKGADEFEKLTRASWVSLTMSTRNLTQEQAEASVDSAIKRGALFATETRYTTQAARTHEVKVLAIEKAGRGAVSPIGSVESVAQMVRVSNLNEGQRDAVSMILTSPNRFTGVQGYAGTGKSHMMSKAVEGIKAEATKLSTTAGYKVIGLAPYASQNRALEELGMQSQTLASFLARKSAHTELNERSIIFLDEAGVVPAHQLQSLMSLVEQRNARLVMIGDRQQTQAVEAGKPFEQLQDAGMTKAFLTEIRRQNDVALKAAVTHAAQGEIPQAVEVLKNHTVQIAGDTQRYQAIAKAYSTLSADERNNTIIVAGTNDARKEINRLVRDSLALPDGQQTTVLNNVDMTRAEAKSARTYQPGQIVIPQRDYGMTLAKGEQYLIEAHDARKNMLTLRGDDGKSVTVDPSRSSMLRLYERDTITVSPGDWIRVTATEKAKDLRNGERFQVAAVDAGHIAIKKGAEVVKIDRSKPLHLQHGYASTIHSAQGLTTKRVLIDANTKSLTSNRAVFYVAISRPRDNLTIFTNDKNTLARAMGRVPKKYAALELRDAKSEAFILRAKAEQAAQARLAAQLRKTPLPPKTQTATVRRSTGP